MVAKYFYNIDMVAKYFYKVDVVAKYIYPVDVVAKCFCNVDMVAKYLSIVDMVAKYFYIRISFYSDIWKQIILLSTYPLQKVILWHAINIYMITLCIILS